MKKFLISALLMLGAIFGCSAVASASSSPPIYGGNFVSASMPQYNAMWYDPLLCTSSSHDDSVGVQAAVNAAGAAGGGTVLIPFAHCYFQHTVNVNYSNVRITGLAAGVLNNPGTRITWWPQTNCGTSTGPLFNFYPTGTTALEADGLANLYLDGSNGGVASSPCAGQGVIVNSVQFGTFQNLSANTFSNFTLECTSTHTLSGQGGTLHSTFNNLSFWDYAAANTGTDLLVTSDTTASAFDCNQNTFEDIYLGHVNGPGADFKYADHNVLFNVQGFTASSGTGVDIVFDCNSFYNLGYNGSASVTSEGTTACGAGKEALHNRWVDVDAAPGSAIVISTLAGATFSYTDNTGNENSSGVFTLTNASPISLAGTGTNTIASNATGANDAFVLNANNASAPTGKLLNLEVGGSTLFYVSASATNPYMQLGAVGVNSQIALGNTDGQATQRTVLGTGTTVCGAASNFGNVTPQELCVLGWNSTKGFAVDKNGNAGAGGTISAGAHNVCGASSGVPCETTVTCAISAATTCAAPAFTAPTGSICGATPNGSDTTTGEYAPKVNNSTFVVTFNVSASQTSTAAANILCL